MVLAKRVPISSTFPGATRANQYGYSGVLWSAASPWRTTLPSGTTLDSDSASYFNSSSPLYKDMHGPVYSSGSGYYTGGTYTAHKFDVMIGSSGVPLFFADGSTPRFNLIDDNPTWGTTTQAKTNVPIPAAADASSGDDAHMAIWDVPRNLLYEFWRYGYNGALHIEFGIVWDTRGDGYQTGAWVNGARASGVSLVAGAIRYEEIVAGVIPHALAMSGVHVHRDYARGAGSGGIMGIASHSDNSWFHYHAQGDSSTNPNPPGGSTLATYSLVEGSRFRLKSSVDIAARVAASGEVVNDAAAIAIGVAARDYGVYVVDHAGVPVIYGETLAERSISWSGKLASTDARWMNADDFELIDMPALTAPP